MMADQISPIPFHRYEVSEEVLSSGTTVYVAFLEDHHGCRAQGPTRDAAIQALRDLEPAYMRALARPNAVESQLASGAPVRISFSFSTHSDTTSHSDGPSLLPA